MRVEKILNGLEGVKRARVSLKKNRAEIIYDDKKTTVEIMKNAVIEAGYNIDE
jgi:copper chaperone